MTLIMSRISNHYVLQVSDRLVSKSRRPVDPAANKTLIIITKGGAAAISYTGLAVINSIPTDQWLAEILTGIAYPPGTTPHTVSFGVPCCTRSFHDLAAYLQRKLSAIFKERAQIAQRLGYFDIMISGWQWGNCSRPRATNISIERKQGTETFIISRSPRHLARQQYKCYLTPQANVTLIDDIESKKRISEAQTVEETQQALIWIIRDAASRSTIVGPHCMSIMIPHPYIKRTIVVSYHGAPAKVELVSAKTGERVAIVNTDYSPWVIGPNLVMAPAIVNGNTTIGTAGYEVVIKANNYTNEGPQIVFTQTRPKL